ncbi:right-handed parallel beta-helix repeat-containing protein [Cellulomonas composti]|uniref:Right handed beta helix domain-containing protein n=1 Tax=Cellulomonas composti TaxID=266130 RepID=A0A511JB16_9CELL|nr:right-handed parallel beta-helix repeat-containing protein [Cellulomonas composti]GEL94979.1 hypothetical protein CCO02nite_16370 [Cellulomonas composti]
MPLLPRPRHARRTGRTALVLALAAAVASAAITPAAGATAKPSGQTAWAVAANDTFTRKLSTGWGAAEVGGAWQASAASPFAVSGTTGTLKLAAGATSSALLSSISATDVDLRTSVAIDKLPWGGATTLTFSGRRIAGKDYGVRLRLQSARASTVALVAGSSTVASVRLPDLTARTSAKLQVRVQVTGTSPTTIRAKVWRSGTTEPTDWLSSTTSSTTNLQSAGAVGVTASVAREATTAPVTIRYDDVTVRTLQPVPTTPTTIGVPPGTKITKVQDGNVTITADGTVIDGWDIRGYVSVRAKNVVIRNSYIRGTAVPQTNDLVRVQGDAYSVTIEDSTLSAQTASPNVDGVKGWNFTLRRVEISNVVDTVHIHGSHVLVESSWLHDNSVYEQDPNWGGSPSHADSVQIQQGTDIVIRNNTISGANNAAVMLTQDSGAVSALTISGNKIDGGACSVNIKVMETAPSGVTLADNTFGRGQLYRNCAIRVPTAWALDLRANVWVDGGDVARTNI